MSQFLYTHHTTFPNNNVLPNMCVYVLSDFSRVQLVVSIWTVACQALCPWDSIGRNTAVVSHFLLQGSSQSKDQSASLVSPALAGRIFPPHTSWDAPLPNKVVIR